MTQKTTSFSEQESVVEEPALFKEVPPSKSGGKKFWLFVILAASGLMIFLGQGGVKGTAVLKSERFAQIGLVNPGVLKELFHRKGDSVQVGEVLARFENSDIANQTREKEASLEILGHDRSRLEKKMQFFEKEFERRTILYENGVIAKAALDSAESDLFQVKEEFAMRQKEYETVKSEVHYFEERMASLELKAPFAGVILSDPKEAPLSHRRIFHDHASSHSQSILIEREV
jgi:multidrug resistance efflux pump